MSDIYNERLNDIRQRIDLIVIVILACANPIFLTFSWLEERSEEPRAQSRKNRIDSLGHSFNNKSDLSFSLAC
jgi:hypothetical protein